jgi:hypothetical protein
MNRLVGDGAAVVSAIEHTAVLHAAEDLSRPVKYAPVHPDGRLDLEKFAALLPGAAMVSVMAANNETGVLQPVRESSRMARERGLPMHSDAIRLAVVSGFFRCSKVALRKTIAVRARRTCRVSSAWARLRRPCGGSAMITQRCT